MKDRIKQIRKEINLTQQEFADKLGISRSTVATYEVGKSEPSDAAISLMCKTFNINEQWLRYGEGEKSCSLTREQEIANIVAVLFQEEEASFRFRVVKAICAMSVEEVELWEKKTAEIFL